VRGTSGVYYFLFATRAGCHVTYARENAASSREQRDERISLLLLFPFARLRVFVQT